MLSSTFFSLQRQSSYDTVPPPKGLLIVFIVLKSQVLSQVLSIEALFFQN